MTGLMVRHMCLIRSRRHLDFASGYDLVRNARATRKTIVFGTISDYPGERSRRYRRIAREALEVADRVVFVGPSASHVSKAQDRLFSFETVYQASAFLSESASAGELIYVKGSIIDHLERIMLSEVDQVVCWLERCGISVSCQQCKKFLVPAPPPLGLADYHFRRLDHAA